MRMIAVLLALCLFAACSSPPEDQPVGIDWSMDISFMRDSLPVLHYNLFLHTAPEAYYDDLDRLESDLADMEDIEVAMELERILASTCCSHTRLEYYDVLSDAMYYPFKYFWFDDGIFVTMIGENSLVPALGAQVLTIDGHPTEEAASTAAEYAAGRNSMSPRHHGPALMTRARFMEELGYGDTESGMEFVLLAEAGDTLTMMVEPVHSLEMSWTHYWPMFGVIPTYLFTSPPGTAPYWFSHIPEKEALYCGYNSCMNDPSYPFSSFAAQVDSILAAESISTIVIDLRHNVGGNSQVFQPLLQSIEEHLAQNGTDLFVLIDRETISSGIMNAVHLRNMGGLLVGEATADPANFLGENMTVSLPASGITIWYPVQWYRMVEGDGASLEPDIPVPVMSAEFFTGGDPCIDLVLGTTTES